MGDTIPQTSEVAQQKPEQNSSAAATQNVEGASSANGGEIVSSSESSKKRAQSQTEDGETGGAVKRVKGVAPIKNESVTQDIIHKRFSTKYHILTIPGTYSTPTAISPQKLPAAPPTTTQPKPQMTATAKSTRVTAVTAAKKASKAGKTKRKRRRSKKVKIPAAVSDLHTTSSNSATHVPTTMNSPPPTVPLATAASWSTTCAGTSRKVVVRI